MQHSQENVRGVKPKKCCVVGCGDMSSKRHRFPKNEPDVYKLWLVRLKPPHYESLSVEDIYNKYVVCERHFTPDLIVPESRRGLKPKCYINSENCVT